MDGQSPVASRQSPAAGPRPRTQDGSLEGGCGFRRARMAGMAQSACVVWVEWLLPERSRRKRPSCRGGGGFGGSVASSGANGWVDGWMAAADGRGGGEVGDERLGNQRRHPEGDWKPWKPWKQATSHSARPAAAPGDNTLPTWTGGVGRGDGGANCGSWLAGRPMANGKSWAAGRCAWCVCLPTGV